MIEKRNVFMTEMALIAIQSTNKKNYDDFINAKSVLTETLICISEHTHTFAAQIALGTLKNMDKYKNSKRVTFLSSKQCKVLAEFIVKKNIQFNY